MPTTLHSAQAAARWLGARVPGALRTDSRALQPGDGFIAWPGYATDARRYVRGALQAGAAACLVEHEGVAAFDLPNDERVASLSGLKAATGEVAAIFYGRPGVAMNVLAVTGTNGKSSTAWWTAQALTSLGRRCGLVGTLGIGEPPRAGVAAAALGAAALPATAGIGLMSQARVAAELTQPTGRLEAPAGIRATGLTTPDPVILQAALRDMLDRGFAACAIEASSIGLAEQRLVGTPVAVAQFTNFTRDHLDYHGDMAAYWACKRSLFDAPGLRAAVVNVDDAQGASLAAELAARSIELWTVSTRCAEQTLVATAAAGAPSTARSAARLVAQNIRYVDGGLAFEVVEDGVALSLRSTLVGDYNASNLLVVLGGLRALGVPLADALQVVPGLTPVPGRMQPVGQVGSAPQPAVVVDYAHTPDALDKALAALRPLAAARGGRLWCVFGCGGDRDASKRPLMGAIAQRLADSTVVTSDNPRGESPEAILAQIVAGMAAEPAPQVIADRRQAIEYAVNHAAVVDLVLIAGKGHETTQEVAGVKQPFSDVEVALRGLAARRLTC